MGNHDHHHGGCWHSGCCCPYGMTHKVLSDRIPTASPREHLRRAEEAIASAHTQLALNKPEVADTYLELAEQERQLALAIQDVV